jgi:hypothetical protein
MKSRRRPASAQRPPHRTRRQRRFAELELLGRIAYAELIVLVEEAACPISFADCRQIAFAHRALLERDEERRAKFLAQDRQYQVLWTTTVLHAMLTNAAPRDRRELLAAVVAAGKRGERCA